MVLWNEIGNDPDTVINFVKDVIPGYGFVEEIVDNYGDQTRLPKMPAERDPLYGILIGAGTDPDTARDIVNGINRVGDDPETLLTILPGYGTVKHIFNKLRK